MRKEDVKTEEDVRRYLADWSEFERAVYLETFKIDQSGVITAVYSNGSNRTIGQIALASFTNPGGLEKSGETNFVQSNNSGMADIGPSGIAGKGKIIAGTLEMSNVDLAEQFTDMIVTYPAVRDRLGDVFTNWLTKADELRTVAELYFGTLYNKGMYLRFQLLSLAQALECYSRLRLHPKDNKGFRARVEEMLGTLQPDTVKLICRDQAYFAEVVVDTRDYFTHYLEKHRARSPEGSELYMLTRRIWLLLTVLLLKEVGLDESLIAGLIGRHPKLMQWLTPHPARPTAIAST